VKVPERWPGKLGDIVEPEIGKAAGISICFMFGNGVDVVYRPAV
jgi:hypothetical protein